VDERGEVAASGDAAADDERFRQAWGDRDRIIVVPLDRAPDSLIALLAARVVAGVTRATIKIVLLSLGEVVGGAPPAAGGERQTAADIGLTRDHLRGAIVERLSTAGEVADTVRLYAEAHRAMLVAAAVYVAGPRMTPLDLTSLRRLVESAHCPLLLARPEAADRVRASHGIRRILLPLDGEPTSAAAIRPALDIARRACAALDILFVESGASKPTEPGAMRSPRFVDQPQHEWKHWSAEFVRRFGTALGSCHRPTDTHVFLRRGEPADEIVRVAAERDVDLIVLSWHGSFGLGRSGSDRAVVVRAVVEGAPCPVLLLRATEAGAADLPGAD
jgi:nucleotide-binding universal stress UspA family protein